MNLFLIIFSVIVLVIVVKFLLDRKRLLKFTKKFPSPPNHPLLGILPLLTPDPVQIFKIFHSFHETYGKNIITWGLLNDFSIVISDPKDLEIILSSSKLIRKSYEYCFLHNWLGTGLLVSDGKKWFTRRRIITPTFHFNILEQFIDVFNKQVDVLVEKLRPNVDGPDFNVYEYTTLCALDIICEASMGIDIKAQDKSNLKYVSAVKLMSLIIFHRFFSITSTFSWLYPLTKTYWEERGAVKILHEFTDDVIRARRQQLKNSPENDQKLNDNESDIYFRNNNKKKLALLDLLLQATVDGIPLSDSDIREEVDTFMFEGHDTTTSGVSFTIYHLAENQEVQQKAYEEIIDIMGKDKKAALNYNVLQEMKYLEKVIKESLRLTPPVPFMGRALTEDTVISGVLIPAKTDIVISVYNLHHDPDIYPNPDKFDPERFSAEESNGRNAYAYVPFSAGPRNCIGQKFAMLELKATIAKLLLNYKILPSDSAREILLQGDLILKTKEGINVRITERC